MSNTRIAEEVRQKAEELRREINKMHGCRVEPDVTGFIAETIQTALDTQRAEFERGEDNVATLYHRGDQLYVRFPTGKHSYVAFGIHDEHLKMQYADWLASTSHTPRLVVAHTPRTSQQSEAVIAAALGKNLTVVETPEAIKSLGV